MQRSYIIPVVLAILAALLYLERRPLIAVWRDAMAKIERATVPAAEPPSESESKQPGSAATGTPPSAVRRHAPPGIFYMVSRAKVVSKTGIKAVSPGETVKLLERLPGGRMRVTTDDADFEVKASQVTDDPDVAQEAAERFERHPENEKENR